MRTLSVFWLLGNLYLTVVAQKPVPSAPASSVAYTITALGSEPKFPLSEAYAINNQGNIVGKSYDSSLTTDIPFLWRQGKRVPFPNFGQPICEAYSINNLGHMAGWVTLGKGPHSKSLPGFWGRKLISLGNTEGIAYGINNRDEVVGEVTLGPLVSFDTTKIAFVWRNGKMLKLGRFGGKFSVAHGINDRGEIVGFSDTVKSISRPCIWRSGKIYPLAMGKAVAGAAQAINNRGDIVGSLEIVDPKFYAVLWRQGKLLKLGMLPGGHVSNAMAINSRGVVVGYADVTNDNSHAFIWRHGQMQDLNALIPVNSGWELTRADGINDQGQIVGLGTYHGQECAFLLTPQK
jgi:probable HAF family extracellular repeat protein